jgi:chromosome segregation ATPase
MAAILLAIAASGADAGQAAPEIPGLPEIAPAPTAPIGSVLPASAPPAAPPAASSAVAPAAPAPAAPVTAAPAGPPLSDAEHLARGDIQYGGAWLPIDAVFKGYLAARTELQPIEAKLKTARDGIVGIQTQMNVMKNESLQTEQPFRKDIAKQMAKRRELVKDSEAQPPPKPKLLQVPVQQRQYSSNMHSQYSSGNSNQYDQQQQEWQRQRDQIDRANDAAQKKYAQDRADWKKAKDTADKELPNVDQAIKDFKAKIDQNTAALTTRQAPLLEKVKAANEDAQAIGRRIEAVQTRLNALAAALNATPETLRLKHGIVDWEGVFRPLADIEKQLAEAQAEINRVCEQMKAEATAAGRPLADNWRHPQQDRLDAMRAMVDRAKAAARAAG